eukprot:m.25696 g.25696  ORF g.25696 m.25696 type:complete len:732 (-) comp8750_c1_seq1:761-2956(-)
MWQEPPVTSDQPGMLPPQSTSSNGLGQGAPTLLHQPDMVWGSSVTSASEPVPGSEWSVQGLHATEDKGHLHELFYNGSAGQQQDDLSLFPGTVDPAMQSQWAPTSTAAVTQAGQPPTDFGGVYARPQQPSASMDFGGAVHDLGMQHQQRPQQQPQQQHQRSRQQHQQHQRQQAPFPGQFAYGQMGAPAQGMRPGAFNMNVGGQQRQYQSHGSDFGGPGFEPQQQQQPQSRFPFSNPSSQWGSYPSVFDQSVFEDPYSPDMAHQRRQQGNGYQQGPVHGHQQHPQASGYGYPMMHQQQQQHHGHRRTQSHPPKPPHQQRRKRFAGNKSTRHEHLAPKIAEVLASITLPDAIAAQREALVDKLRAAVAKKFPSGDVQLGLTSPAALNIIGQPLEMTLLHKGAKITFKPSRASKKAAQVTPNPDARVAPVDSLEIPSLASLSLDTTSSGAPTTPAAPVSREDVTLHSGEALTVMCAILEEEGMTQIDMSPHSRVPSIKCYCPAQQLPVSITFNDRFGYESSRLLAAYASLDRRVVQLSLLIKYWASRRHINDPRRGFPSTYAYCILTIFFLQARPVPLLPSLQKMVPDAGQDIDSFYFCEDETYISRLGYCSQRNPNHESICQLLVEFFRYYAHQFNYREHVISVQWGRVLTKAEKSWTTRFNGRRERFYWCIEDPFDINLNLGRICDKENLYDVRGEFMRGHEILMDYSDIDKLLEPLKTVNPESAGLAMGDR